MLGELLGGRYRIIQTLAQGGFGQTYVAEDIHRPGTPRCVVKQLKPARNNPQFLENARRLFLAEAETLERLGNHDQIPRLLAYFEEKHKFYLIQDFIEGQPLKRELSPGEQWPEYQVIELLQEVLNILFFVHSHGVIHRNIKPDSLIRRYQDWKLILVDFGSVKQIRSQMAIPNQTTGAIAIGTPGYMSTEQARGRPRFSSDIYSLGILAIQAATGLSPNQLQEDPDTGEIFWQPWAKISKSLTAILSKMVRYHFKDRYQSATEALQAIETLSGSDPTTLPPEVVTPVAPAPALTGQVSTPGQESAVPVSQQPPHAPVAVLETPEIQELAKDSSRFSQEPNPTVMSTAPPKSATIEKTPASLPVETAASPTVLSAAPPSVAKPIATDSAAAPEPQSTVMSLEPEATSTPPPLSAPSLAAPQPTLISPQPSKAAETLTLDQLIEEPEGAEGLMNQPEADAPILDQSIEEPQTHLDLLNPEQITPESKPIKTENALATALATASTIAAARWRDLHTNLSGLSARLIKFQPTRSHYLAGTGAVALLVGAIVSYRYYTARLTEQPSYQPIQSSLAPIKQLQEDAHNRLSQYLLQQAKELADQSQLKDAILIISGIPSPEATQLIQQWSEKMLQIATERYQQHGKLEEAIAIANAIPAVAPITEKAPTTVEAWQADWQKNNAHVQAAEQALQQGQWQSAIRAAQQVSNTPYWQKQATSIVVKANAATRADNRASVTAPATRSRPARRRPPSRRAPSGSSSWRVEGR